MDTIFALSSGALPSGVAIIRISGPEARSVFGLFGCEIPDARNATLATLIDRTDQSALDRGLVLFFPGPNSFTGEDVVELQLHGSRATVARALDIMSAQANWRPAVAGEFTRRAFEHGRMDLTSVEGLGDLLAAETEQQRRYALQQSDGALGRTLEDLRDSVLQALAVLEASLEFSDEEDVPDDGLSVISERLTDIVDTVKALLASFEAGRVVRDGYRVVLVGQPNVGKSSLLNALAGSDRAIVTPEAGTTRDLLEVEVDIGGYLVRLIDTAGLRDAESLAEQEGVRRSYKAVDGADLVLSLRSKDISAVDLPDDKVMPIWAKSDLAQGPDGILAISTADGSGLDALFGALAERLELLSPPAVGVINRARHKTGLSACLRMLELAQQADLEHDIRSEHLRLAANEIGALTGRVHPEEVLDRVFSGFCIGK